MIQVHFYEAVEDALLKFAVIIARTNGQWVFCKHRERGTYEVPGGRREAGETILETARRELWEETGAIEFQLKPVCVYSVEQQAGEESFGMLYTAEITAFESELHHEIERILITESLVEDWTYPLIQPKLIAEAGRRNCL